MGGNIVYTAATSWRLVIGSVGLLGSSVVHAQRVVAAERESTALPRVTVHVTNGLLSEVLQMIAQQAGLIPVYNAVLIPETSRVTLRVRDLRVDDAFEQALRGTGLVARFRDGGQVAFVRAASVMTGIITGRVMDAKTKQPLRGARIGVDDASRVVETADDGTYRLAGVNAGSHTITIKLLGYTKAVRTVTVQDNSATTVDVVLESSAMPLEQVVVTGTVIPTELKAIPNAITVITAKQIEERGITKIDQLFRGDVPGLFAQRQGSGPTALLDEVTMYSRGATALSNASAGISADITNGGQSFLTNPIKTYLDGVELADSKYLSQLDPKSIERIEILTGPQASTIYGSGAINGVMQIFTKRGSTSRPQLQLNLLSGWVANNFSSALTPQHDYSAQVSGVEGRISYNAGGSWNYTGPWTPAKQSARRGGFGGTRFELPTSVGRVTADLSLRRSVTQSLQRGSQFQTMDEYRASGWWNYFVAVGLSVPSTHTLIGQTLGVTLTYTPLNWWSHEVGLGQDLSDTEDLGTSRGYLYVSDSTLSLSQSHTDRRSLRYTTTVRLPITPVAQATITAGADAWQNLMSSMRISPQTLTGPLTGSTVITRQPGHNAGSFLQSQIGIKERLFVTYGLRAEWNPNFGANAQPNYAPRYGVSYTQDMNTPLGSVTVKVRGSYGRATRPPAPGLKREVTIQENVGAANWASLSTYYDPFIYSFANPDLAPEHQQGGEGGLELYFGTRGSLVATRYNQTVDGLISKPVIDSVALRPQWQAVYGSWAFPQYQYQYLNLGTIRNQGWELQGSMYVGPLTTRGTYSWTKSRTIGVNPKYRAYFANKPQYTPGATFQYLPEHTWALGVTYARASTTVGLNITGTGQATIDNDDFYFQHLSGSIRLPQNRFNVSNIGYINHNSGYALADLTASHQFLPRVEGVLQLQNLADRYTNDYSAFYASMGRQVSLGARIRAQ